MVLTDRKGIKEGREITGGLQVVAKIGNLLIASEELVERILVNDQINNIRLVAGVRSSTLGSRSRAKQFVRVVQFSGVRDMNTATRTLVYLHAVTKIVTARTSHRRRGAYRNRSRQKGTSGYFFGVHLYKT